MGFVSWVISCISQWPLPCVENLNILWTGYIRDQTWIQDKYSPNRKRDFVYGIDNNSRNCTFLGGGRTSACFFLEIRAQLPVFKWTEDEIRGNWQCYFIVRSSFNSLIFISKIYFAFSITFKLRISGALIIRAPSTRCRIVPNGRGQ